MLSAIFITCKYDTFLGHEIATLQAYIDKIKVFTELVKQYTSEDDDLFSFMNCKFIKDKCIAAIDA